MAMIYDAFVSCRLGNAPRRRLSQGLGQARRALPLAWPATALLLALVGGSGWPRSEAIAQGDVTQASEVAPDVRHSQAMALGELSATHEAQGETQSALEAADASRAILLQLTATDPGRTEWQSNLSVAHGRMADMQRAAGKSEQAMEGYRASLAIMEKLAAADPGNAKWQQDLGAGFERMGDALSDVGERERALDMHMQAMTIRASLARSEPDDVQRQRDLSLSYDRIGAMFVVAGQFEDALEIFQKGLGIRRRLLAHDPGNALWQRDLSISLEKVGDAFGDLGKRDDALASHEESLGIRRKIPEEANPSTRTDLARALRRTGDVLAALQRVPEALVRYDASIETKPDIAISYRARGIALLYGGRTDAAIADLQAAVRYSPSHPYGVIWLHIARLRAGNPDPRELARNAGRLERGKWPWAIIDVFLGASPAETVRAGAQGARDAKARREQACEADFYIGAYQATQGRGSESLRLYQSAADKCPPGFAEYTAAHLELRDAGAQAGTRTLHLPLQGGGRERSEAGGGNSGTVPE